MFASLFCEVSLDTRSGCVLQPPPQASRLPLVNSVAAACHRPLHLVLAKTALLERRAIA